MILVSLLGILTVDATIENLRTDMLVNEFIDKAEYVFSQNNFHFYEVEIEEKLDTPSISFTDANLPYIPTPGDIFIYRESMLDVLPLATEFITYYFGGHAGIVYYDNKVIETTGAEPIFELNKVLMIENNVFFRPEQVDSVGLRVKATSEQVDDALKYVYSAIDSPYNYSFVFNRKNSYYCTDLISRSYGKEAGLNFKLDEDGIATSCNDLILSDDTFITYYLINKGYEKHLYYAVNK